MGLNVEYIDHFVLSIGSIKIICDFYSKAKSMEVVRSQDGWISLNFGFQKINLHSTNSETNPKVQHPVPGSSNFCLIVSSPIEQVVKHFQSYGIEIECGPVARKGATGEIGSVYIRDPYKNLVEISAYRNSHRFFV